MEEIKEMSAYHLILRYPTIAYYIQEAYNRGNHEELIDFLFGLELEDVVLC